MKGDTFGATVECRQLSIIRSFYRGPWLSSIYTPPVTAQFLKDVSLQVGHGEIDGVMGAAGCGKSTLLEVISGRADGSVSGEVLLNEQVLTTSRFTNLCEFVDFEVDLLTSLSVEQLLKYHARLSLNCNGDAVTHRVLLLMQQFDLAHVSALRVGSLSESARRRVILVLYLIKDPILILIDDPLKGLDALSGYQLMSALREHVQRHSRMAIVTMRCPRSDIYQFLARTTLLFYGEVVYSGPTKYMPHYFSQIGYRCNVNENPAVYYLSLATVDRETPESYSESQAKGRKLVQTFKKQRETLDFSSFHTQQPSDAPILSCYFGAPSSSMKLWVITTRNLAIFRNSPDCIMAQCLLLFTSMAIAVFGAQFGSGSNHLPMSAAGTVFCLTLFSSLSGIVSTLFCFGRVRSLMYFEVAEGLYNATLMLAAFVVSTIIFDVASILMSASGFILITTPDIDLNALVATTAAVGCQFMAYKLLVLALHAFIPDGYAVSLVSITACCLSTTLSSGFLKSYRSFTSINDWLIYATGLSVERFSNLLLYNELVNRTVAPSCQRLENPSIVNSSNTSEFCRWKTGQDFLSEILPESLAPPEIWHGPVLVLSILPALFVVFFLVGQRYAQKNMPKRLLLE